jgi:hypothetical protein
MNNLSPISQILLGFKDTGVRQLVCTKHVLRVTPQMHWNIRGSRLSSELEDELSSTVWQVQLFRRIDGGKNAKKNRDKLIVRRRREIGSYRTTILAGCLRSNHATV